MENRKCPSHTAPGDQLPASRGMLEGQARLGCAVITQACKDLYDFDHPAKVVDALAWLIDDGYLWLDALGVSLEPGVVIKMAATAKARNVLWWIRST